MTPELHKRWCKALPPFDGNAVVADLEHDIGALRDMIAFLLDVLRHQFPAVLAFDDWHEHDGFISEARQTSWESVANATKNPQAIYQSRHNDFAVRRGLHPPSFEWVLRYNIDDEDPSNPATAWCDLDFSCTPTSDVARLVECVNRTWPDTTEVVCAKQHFDKAYGG